VKKIAFLLYLVVVALSVIGLAVRQDWAWLAIVLASGAFGAFLGLTRRHSWVQDGPIDLAGAPAIAAAARADELGSPQANQVREFGGKP
jgi:hypothetical protein